MTSLAGDYPSVANVHLSAVEHKDRIVFLHHVEEGPASQSYGLAVAQLAGVPGKVIREARRYLTEWRTTPPAACSQIYLSVYPRRQLWNLNRIRRSNAFWRSI